MFEEEYDPIAERKRLRKEKRDAARHERISRHNDWAQQKKVLREPAWQPIRRNAVRRPRENVQNSSVGLSQAVKSNKTASTREETRSKYVPPSLRAKGNKKSNDTVTLVRRICNKLTVKNVVELSRNITCLFTEEGNSRADVVESLAQHVSEDVVGGSTELTATVAMAISGMIRGLQLLHGASFVSTVVSRLTTEVSKYLNEINENGAVNCSKLIAFLYCLNCVDCNFIVGGLTYFLQGHVTEGGFLCALTILRACGEKLVSEAPVQLNQIVKLAEDRSKQSIRSEALLSLCKDIARGKSRKGARKVTEEQLTTEEIVENLMSLLIGEGTKDKRALLRALSTKNVLAIPWGTHEHDSVEDHSEGEVPDDEAGLSSDDERELEIERKKRRIETLRTKEKAVSGQRFATEAKRQIFQCIASATDDVECFHMLTQRDPSGSQLHDVASVLLQLCAQESLYNSFYCDILQRLLGAKKQFKSILQFALWDRFKAFRVEAADVTSFVNIAFLITTLVEEGALTLSVLRGLDLESTSRSIGMFTRILLLRLLTQLPSERLVSFFFGGDGKSTNDTKVDTALTRKCLEQMVARYFVDEAEASKWLPLFFDVVAVGTPFADGNNAEMFLKRVRGIHKALREGLA